MLFGFTSFGFLVGLGVLVGLGFWFSWCLMGLLAGLVLWRDDLWFGGLGNLLRFRSGVVRYNTVPVCLACGDCL